MRKELNNLKNKVINLMIITIIIFIISCKPVTTITYKEEDYTTFPTIVNGMMKDKKIYLTSIGQSNDINNFEYVVNEQLNLFSYEADPLLKAKDIEKDSVVLAFVGCSVKALGESGISVNEELNRTKEIVKGCSNGDFLVIAFHLGGPSRRGTTSDQFIELMFANSNFNIFVATGNTDKFLTDISFQNNVPCYQINNQLALENPLRQLLGLEVK